MKDRIDLFNALVSIRDMPAHDQDDVHRLRHIAATAIEEHFLRTDAPSRRGKNKQILTEMQIGETRFIGKGTRQNFLKAASRLGITLATRMEDEGLYVWRVK